MENYKEMLEKTKKSKERFDELTDEIMKPEVIADNRSWKKLVKERNSLEDIANAYQELLSLSNNLDKCEEDVKTETDAEMKKLYLAEITSLKEQIEKKVEDMKVLLLLHFLFLQLFLHLLVLYIFLLNRIYCFFALV